MPRIEKALNFARDSRENRSRVSDMRNRASAPFASIKNENWRNRVSDITSEAQTIAVGQLRAFIERIERLEEEKKTIADDIKEVYAELKGSGFDSKVVRTIIRLRKKEDHERQEEEAMLQLYMDALGMG
jgi:uncharacterized protein (UPF0335 family)